MKVHYPKLYNMAHLLALNVLLLPKDLTIIFIQVLFSLRQPFTFNIHFYKIIHKLASEKINIILYMH